MAFSKFFPPQTPFFLLTFQFIASKTTFPDRGESRKGWRQAGPPITKTGDTLVLQPTPMEISSATKMLHQGKHLSKSRPEIFSTCNGLTGFPPIMDPWCTIWPTPVPISRVLTSSNWNGTRSISWGWLIPTIAGTRPLHSQPATMQPTSSLYKVGDGTFKSQKPLPRGITFFAPKRLPSTALWSRMAPNTIHNVSTSRSLRAVAITSMEEWLEPSSTNPLTLVSASLTSSSPNPFYPTIPSRARPFTNAARKVTIRLHTLVPPPNGTVQTQPSHTVLAATGTLWEKLA